MVLARGERRLAARIGVVAILCATTGCHFAAGPVFGYVLHDSREDKWDPEEKGERVEVAPPGPWTYGFEFGGGYLIAKLNAGIQTQTGRPEFSYLVLEIPVGDGVETGEAQLMFGGGPTIGAGLIGDEPVFVVGAFAGTSWVRLICRGDEEGFERPHVSLAFGYRYAGGRHEIYLTPKVGFNECFDDF